MKNTRVLRFSIISFCLMAVMGAALVSESRAQANPMKEVLGRMDAHYKGLTTLTSDVTMVKYNSQIQKSDTTTGRTSYLPKSGKRKMYVRIDWVKPVEENIVVIGDDYIMYRPALKQVIKGKASSSKSGKVPGSALSFMSMSEAQLKANYTTMYAGEESLKDGTRTWHIILTPKTTASYKSAELWVDKDGMPRQAKINENNGDATTIFLSKVVKNERIDTAIFQLKPPPGTKEIKG